jgi:hypothetical protein
MQEVIRQRSGSFPEESGQTDSASSDQAAGTSKQRWRNTEELNMGRRRLIVSTLFGFLAGLVCYLGGRYGLKDDISTYMFAYILVNRALIGFVIGLSASRMHWALHGPLIGLIVGVPFAAGCLLGDGNIETAVAALILGALYGLMIEFFTSVVFRARRARRRVSISAPRERHGVRA